LIGSKITGIVGRNGSYTAENSNTCIIIPTVNEDTVTPHAEAFQAVIWHLLVSHPKLKFNKKNRESSQFYKADKKLNY
jgi:D-sedoheptulose 7-phosphate isomerase